MIKGHSAQLIDVELVHLDNSVFLFLVPFWVEINSVQQFGNVQNMKHFVDLLLGHCALAFVNVDILQQVYYVARQLLVLL